MIVLNSSEVWRVDGKVGLLALVEGLAVIV